MVNNVGHNSSFKFWSYWMDGFSHFNFVGRHIVMDKQELIEKLNKVMGDKEQDAEVYHYAADSLLLEYIGDEEIKKAYDEIEKWYA